MTSLSFDCAVANLLCAEDTDSILDDNDYYVAVAADCNATWHHGNLRIPHNQGRPFDGRDAGLPMRSNECLALMVEKECQHYPSVDLLKRLRNGDLDLEARKEAVDWIRKAHAHFGFGPLCAYLSINYLDRFLSACELTSCQAWMMQLLAVACLSIAAKMEETEVPPSLDLQVGESKFVFEARTIQRMELLVLSTLSWRMQAITPFSFIGHFLKKINNDETPPRPFVVQSVQLILTTIKGIDFLEYRPSEIAAAVAIVVVGKTKAVDPEQALSVISQLVEKDRVLKCVRLVLDLLLINGSAKSASVSLLSEPRGPIGFLDVACFSYKNNDPIAGLFEDSSQNAPDTKRRKLGRPCEV